MKQYIDLLREVLQTGRKANNRTGVSALAISGAMLRFDLDQGFPAVTTKKLAFGAVKAELIGFIRGYDNAAMFRELGCNIWNQNANENTAWLSNRSRKGEDDLGRIYGVQWRGWRGEDGAVVDQLANAVHTILHNPTDRRIIVSAWRPDELHKMALPPCHVLYQFIADPEDKKLDLCMYQRSCDMFLGVPFNIASASLLLSLVAHMTGYTPGTFTHFMADVHIYTNHVNQVLEQIGREPKALPKLVLDGVPLLQPDATIPQVQEALDSIKPEHISLDGYDSHSPLAAPMAV
jgi:thymidylate synthase